MATAARGLRKEPIVVLWTLGSNELVAQSVEQRTFNAWVVGSIPTELTTFLMPILVTVLGAARTTGSCHVC